MTLAEFRFGALDPTCTLSPSGFSRALLTAAGPGVLEIQPIAGESVRLSARGPGREWIMDHHRSFLGLDDDFETLGAKHDAVRRAQQRFGRLRLGGSLSPYQELLMAVLGQRITALEATKQWMRLVTAFGRPAPGDEGLMLPPEPEVLIDMPYHSFHPLGVEKSRAETLRRVALHATFLAGLGASSPDEAKESTRSLTRIDGVGPWTAAVAGGLAFGDADALRVGDFHIKNTVAWALEGRPRGTDEEMLATLAPYSGHRHRVIRWLQLDGWSAPRRGPRRRNVSIRSL